MEEFCITSSIHIHTLKKDSERLFTGVDVTLKCTEGEVKVKRNILAYCCPPLRKKFQEFPLSQPLLLPMSEFEYQDMTAVVRFMYTGVTTVQCGRLKNFTKIATYLKIRGLESPYEDCIPRNVLIEEDLSNGDARTLDVNLHSRTTDRGVESQQGPPGQIHYGHYPAGPSKFLGPSPGPFQNPGPPGYSPSLPPLSSPLTTVAATQEVSLQSNEQLIECDPPATTTTTKTTESTPKADSSSVPTSTASSCWSKNSIKNIVKQEQQDLEDRERYNSTLPPMNTQYTAAQKPNYWTCNLCNKHIPKQAMKPHYETHQDVRQVYPCSWCKRSYLQEKVFRKHERSCPAKNRQLNDKK